MAKRKVQLTVPGSDPESFGARLGQAIEKSSFRSGNALATAIGCSQQSVNNWIRGVAEPSRDRLVVAAHALGVSLAWLATGEGDPCGAPPPAQLIGQRDPADLEPGLVAIPVYTGVRAAAGAGGAVVHETPRSLVALDESWLRRYFRVNPAVLAIFPTTGESMEPTIRGDEMILFDTSEQGYEHTDGIFVIRLEGAILVKRLQYLPGGMVRVSSDNPAYQAYTVQLSDGVDFEVLGRVLLVLGLRAV